MYFKPGDNLKLFCSKQCRDKDRERKFASEESGPPMKPLTAENITDEGYIALVEAIVSRAGADVKNFKPGTQIRVSAEKFFESDYFSALTGLDGETILRDLQEQHKNKKPDPRGRKPRMARIRRLVQCIETGVVYSSLKEAAQAYNIHPSCIQYVCSKMRHRAAGMHWRYVEEEHATE